MKKKTVNQEGRDILSPEKITEFLELPKDILLGASIITIMGNREVTVENYTGILDYREDCILIQGKHYQIRITGKKLRIACYTKEEMKICGLIHEVAYE